MAGMAQDNEAVSRKDKPQGHEYHHTFFLKPLLSRLPLHIHREYHTDCRFSPTSWKLRFNFQQTHITGPISCSVAFKRTDRDNTPVKVFLWMACFIGHHNVFLPSCFSNDNMVPNDVIEGHVAETTLLDHDLTYLLNHTVLFQFFASIKCCHEKNSDKTMSTRKEISGMLF